MPAQKRLNRAELVASALAVADAEGLEAVTIRRIAQLHDVTPMALYRHFPDKDGLLLALAEQLLADALPLPEPDPSAAEDAGTGFSFAYLRQPPYVQRLWLLIAMWFLWYVGNYAFLGDASALLAGHGYTIAGSIAFVALGAAGYPLGAMLMLVLADRLERKRLLFGATAVWMVGMALVATLGAAVLVACGFFLGSLALGLYLQIAYTYTAENFPTRARSSGFAVSDGVGHLGGAVGALALPAVIAATSFQFGFVGIGVTGLAAGVLALAGPNVTGRRLEAVSG